MKILIIEDEHYAAKSLMTKLAHILPEAEVLDVLDSVEESISWFKNHEEPNLIFMDIQLADGLSFGIFEAVKFKAPVIFVTAFDEYAIDAFKLNSIDYLLKPIEEEKLIAAIQKFKTVHHPSDFEAVDWKEMALSLFANKSSYKKRFLIKSGQAYQYLNTEDIAFIFSEDGISFAINASGKKFILDNTLDKIAESLDPTVFFKISRKHLVHISAIHKIHPYLNSRLKLDLNLKTDQELVVSREKVKEFKSWVAG